MTVLLGVLLVVNGVFGLIVWPPFLRRVKQDPRSRDEQGKGTRFLTVHLWLIGIALVLAVNSLVIGIISFFV